MIYNFELSNGIRCVINKLDGVYSVSAGILVGAGSAIEESTENGISHFIEHMNFKGTSTRTALQISEEIDDLGAQINAFTSKEYTCYYIKAISEHFSKAFEILADTFVNSEYAFEEIEKERGVVIEEINMCDDMPDEVCFDLVSRAYYGNLGFGATILGPSKNIREFTREDILNYKAKYYTTDNIVLSFAGAVEVDNVKELCEKYFGCLKPSKIAKVPEYNQNNLKQRLFQAKDIEQAHLALAFESCSSQDDLRDAYQVISGALGGGMSSRLFQSVREKMGLAYNVYSFNNAYKSCGNMTIYAGVGQKNVKACYDAILNEIESLKKTKISEREFKRTREQMKSSLVLSQESTSSQMTMFGKSLLMSNKIFDSKKRLDDINKLTLETVNDVLSPILNSNEFAFSVVAKNCPKFL